jgi:hypothetical protein
MLASVAQFVGTQGGISVSLNDFTAQASARLLFGMPTVFVTPERARGPFIVRREDNRYRIPEGSPAALSVNREDNLYRIPAESSDYAIASERFLFPAA